MATTSSTSPSVSSQFCKSFSASRPPPAPFTDILQPPTLWKSPEAMSPLPSKPKRLDSHGLKKMRVAEYELAIDLLNNDLALDNWLNGLPTDEALSTTVQGSDHDGRQTEGADEVKLCSAKKSRRS